MSKKSQSSSNSVSSGENHDEQFSKLSPLKDTLHLLLRMVLLEVPEDSRVLIVGAGTGQELLYLAEAFPMFIFSVVEPDPSMLEICIKKCKAGDIFPRCTFHEGILETIPGNDCFQAATSILVSHYLPSSEVKRKYFQDIASKLAPKGLLVGADLVTWQPTNSPSNLLGLWKRTMNYANAPVPPEVPAVNPQELENIVVGGGFDSPVFFYQALLMNAWYSRKK